ncbi:E6 protein [Pudu puda papillomavirus 1]|uniref:Protein E6 n=1 Tax=Pudu puda papillomavirus 1 TaxID=1747360 RepID=A0A1I9KI84_9PAPI|nr:E6 protein [Pudu puda papillomavirus 1]ALP46951.1 E6 protein [Pudu puda papillomavirus 1]
MAGLPTSISSLLSEFGWCIDDLFLVCVFCDELMSLEDCTHFENAVLSLIWKNGWPYGCCQRCCRRAGYYECSNFYQFSIFGHDLETLTGQTLLQLCIRCYQCLKKLTLDDKLGLLWNNEPFHNIKNRWKGRCTQCRNAWDALHST